MGASGAHSCFRGILVQQGAPSTLWSSFPGTRGSDPHTPQRLWPALRAAELKAAGGRGPNRNRGCTWPAGVLGAGSRLSEPAFLRLQSTSRLTMPWDVGQVTAGPAGKLRRAELLGDSLVTQVAKQRTFHEQQVPGS